MRKFARVTFRLLVYIVAGFVCLGDYARRRLTRRMTRAERADWLQSWCRLGLRGMGATVDVDGPAPLRGLIGSNQMIYVDILVYTSINACTFVSKHEVRSWPLFGWIASLAGTIYIDRKRAGNTHRGSREMVAALSSDRPMMLFPEGTSTDGSGVLRFHSSLFEAAVETGTPITPAYLSYEVSNGSAANDVCYWGGMSFGAHILRLFAIREVRVSVRFAPTSHVFDDRKMAAATTHAEVVVLSGMRA